MSMVSGESARLHNGPVCTTCGVGYIGGHQCSEVAILRKVRSLLDTLDGEWGIWKRDPNHDGTD